MRMTSSIFRSLLEAGPSVPSATCTPCSNIRPSGGISMASFWYVLGVWATHVPFVRQERQVVLRHHVTVGHKRGLWQSRSPSEAAWATGVTP